MADAATSRVGIVTWCASTPVRTPCDEGTCPHSALWAESRRSIPSSLSSSTMPVLSIPANVIVCDPCSAHYINFRWAACCTRVGTEGWAIRGRPFCSARSDACFHVGDVGVCPDPAGPRDPGAVTTVLPLKRWPAKPSMFVPFRTIRGRKCFVRAHGTSKHARTGGRTQ